MKQATAPPPELAELAARRDRECRLTPDLALADLDGAAAWVIDRGVVTTTASCALPSLFVACHEPSYRPGSRGFGLWPRTKYPWAVELTGMSGILGLKIAAGRRLLVASELARAIDPLCRDALARAAASPLVTHLAAAGPSLVDDLLVELGATAAELRKMRRPLERVGAIVSRSITVPAPAGGHRHTSELRLWTQLESHAAASTSPEQALDDLVAVGVRAAVLAPEAEVGKWFSWPVSKGTVDRLVAEGRVQRPAEGWVAVA